MLFIDQDSSDLDLLLQVFVKGNGDPEEFARQVGCQFVTHSEVMNMQLQYTAVKKLFLQLKWSKQVLDHYSWMGPGYRFLTMHLRFLLRQIVT